MSVVTPFDQTENKTDCWRSVANNATDLAAIANKNVAKAVYSCKMRDDFSQITNSIYRTTTRIYSLTGQYLLEKKTPKYIVSLDKELWTAKERKLGNFF